MKRWGLQADCVRVLIFVFHMCVVVVPRLMTVDFTALCANTPRAEPYDITLWMAFNSAGIPDSKELTHRWQASRQMAWLPWEAGRPVIWDVIVAVACTSANSYVEASACEAGAAAEIAATRRTAKYTHIPSQFVFHPAAVETQWPIKWDISWSVKWYRQTHCLVLWWRPREFLILVSASFSCQSSSGLIQSCWQFCVEDQLVWNLSKLCQNLSKLPGPCPGYKNSNNNS